MGSEGASMYIPRGKGVAKAWYGQFVSLENQFTADHVSASSFSCQIL